MVYENYIPEVLQIRNRYLREVFVNALVEDDWVQLLPSTIYFVLCLDIIHEGNRGALVGAIVAGICFFIIFSVYIFIRCK